MVTLLGPANFVGIGDHSALQGSRRDERRSTVGHHHQSGISAPDAGAYRRRGRGRRHFHDLDGRCRGTAPGIHREECAAGVEPRCIGIPTAGPAKLGYRTSYPRRAQRSLAAMKRPLQCQCGTIKGLVQDPARGPRERLSLVAGALSLACLLDSGCAGLQRAHGPATSRCTATIAVIGAEKACPTATIRFQMSLSGCRRSAGTFAYDFKAVTEARKVTISNSGSWIQTKNAWEQAESVPLECAAEIYDIDHARITTCTCEDH